MNPTEGPVADSSANSPAEPPEGEKKQPKRATTLVDYMQMKSARAGHFVSDLNKGVVHVQQEDLESAATMAGEKPRMLSKVVELTKAAIGRGGVAKETAMRLAVLSIQHQDREFSDWPVSETTPAALSKLASWARIRIRAKTREVKARGENVFSLGLIVLLEQRVLEPALILRELATTYGAATGEGAAGASRNLIKLLQKARPAQLAQFAKIAEFQNAAVEDAFRKVADERQNVAVLEARMAELQQELAGASEALEKSRSEIQAGESQIEALQRQLESARRVGAHDLGDLRARYRRIFSEELEPVINDAADALELNKPEFANDYVANLRKRIAEEVLWLNSSSG